MLTSHFYAILVYVLGMKDSKPSQTAVWIAKGLMYLNQMGRIPEDVHQKSVALWQRCLRITDPMWLKWMSYRYYQIWFGLLERLTIPGLFNHYAARKKMIDNWVQPILASQVEQLIVLAAGFDALTHRYFEIYPNITFIEIDHPATQMVKKAAFNECHPQFANMHFVTADLQKKTLASVLAECCDPHCKTLFIAEGITMYFTEEQNKQFFTELRSYFDHDLHVLFTFMEKQDNGSIQFMNATFIVDYWLRMQQETFQWGIEPAIIASHFLVPLGYQQISLADPTFESKSPKTQGEWLCLARATYD